MLINVERAMQSLEREGVPFRVRESMRRHTTFAIGGDAALYAMPQREEELTACVRLARCEGLPYMILGRGSNVLFGDGAYPGMVIATAALHEVTHLPITDEASGMQYLTAQCGTTLRALAARAEELALAGLEFVHGIPGTVGGALRMNAGAYGGEIGSLVHQVRCYDAVRDGVVTFSRDAFAFGNRCSLLTERTELVCLDATLALPLPDEDQREAVREAIRSRMEDYKQRRRNTQPLEFPSAGSVFKRPAGHYAGKLIEDCALKGTRIGGACVSEKHAGFIVNLGDATAQDVQALIAKVRATVKERFGIELEQEILFYGSDI